MEYFIFGVVAGWVLNTVYHIAAKIVQNARKAQAKGTL